MANALIQNPVDRENHIVHGVKVLGFTSANGRIYDFAAVKEAIAKYEKAPVNKDHNMEEPSFSDRLGWLENVTLEKDGLYADFHYNPHAEGIESFLWFAEHNGLGDVGFSHLVSGKYSVDPDGTERITRIDKVKSVDLVANPATTKTIFESEVKPMKKKIEEASQDFGTGDSVQYRDGFGTIKNIRKFDKGTIYSIRNSRGSEDTLKIYDDEAKNTHADWILKVKKIPNRKEKSPGDQGYDQRSAYNESEKLDQGNNETLSKGIEKNKDGTYTALTYSASKTFRTLAGAKKWMNERPKPMKESDEPVVFGSTVTKTFYDKMKKLAASGSEEGKRQVEWIEDEIKKSEKERKIQKDLWAKHLKNKKSEQDDESMEEAEKDDYGEVPDYDDPNRPSLKAARERNARQMGRPGSKKRAINDRNKKHWDDLAKGETGTKREGYKSIGSTWTPEEWKKQVEKNIADTKKTFPNVKFFTKDGHPDWHAHGINPKTMQYYSKESEQEDKPMGKKIAKEAGNAANKVKKNELDRKKGAAALKDIRDKRSYADKVKYQPSADYQLSGKQRQDEISLGRGIRKFEQEDDSVDEAYKDQPSDPYDLGVFLRKQGGKKTDNPFGDGIGTGKTFNSDQFDRGFSGRPRAIFKTKPGDSGEQEGDDEMDNKKMMEEENPMQQEEAEQDPMMEEADDVYAKVKEVCEGEGSDEEKSKQVLEMLGLSGGMSEAEDDEEMKEDDDEEMKEDDDEDPRKESKSELKSLRKWKSEKLKQEKIVNLIKESNLEPTKVFVKQLSAIDSKLWGEAIRDRRKVALTRSAVKPISSGSQSRSESSYKQFLESVLGK